MSVVTAAAGKAHPKMRRFRYRSAELAQSLERIDRPAISYGLAALLIAAMLVVALLLDRFLGVANASLVLLIAVLTSALASGFGPALFASVLAVVAINFFFLPPLYTVAIGASEDVIALIVFAVVAAITSQLATVARRQLVAAKQQEKATGIQYRFSRRLAGVGSLDELADTTASEIAAALDVHAIVLMSEEGVLRLRAAAPDEAAPDAELREAAESAWRKGASTGSGSARDWRFVPLRLGSAAAGVIGVASKSAAPFDGTTRRLLDSLGKQASSAAERIALAHEAAEARIEAERERLRSALLASISHDLRTPLASIVGGISSLRSYGASYDDEARDDLMATVHEEAERLDRFVGNLLDMARLESGAMPLHGVPVDVAELVDTALRRAATLLEAHRVTLAIDADLPMVEADYLLLEQVVVNLLDNAGNYASAGSTITIAARSEDRCATIEVLDEGPGVPDALRERIFEKFYRADARDRQRAGTGLGLAICRGFVEAMGGTIAARNREDVRGACFSIVLRAAPHVTVPNGGGLD